MHLKQLNPNRPSKEADKIFNKCILILLLLLFSCKSTGDDQLNLLYAAQTSTLILKNQNERTVLTLIQNIDDSTKIARIKDCYNKIASIRKIIDREISDEHSKSNQQIILNIRNVIADSEKKIFRRKIDIYKNFILKESQEFNHISSVSNLKSTTGLELEILINYYINRLAEEL